MMGRFLPFQLPTLLVLAIIISPFKLEGVRGDDLYEYYQALAANLETTPEEFVALGGVVDENCTFAFNATVENCEGLIEGYEESADGGAQECGCYNFCNGQLAGCYDIGAFPPEFECPINKVVGGCQKGGGEKKSPLSPMGEETEPCPPGYMCSEDEQRSCEQIRQIPIDLGLGDVHAGMYCPGTENRTNNNYKVCPIGYYCPDSITKIPCPAGYFCPHKTGIPDIPCEFCDEGVTSMSRRPTGYIVAGAVVLVMILFVLWEMFKRKNARLLQQLVDLRARQVNTIKESLWKEKRQAKLEKLLPKLQAIENRLQKSSGSYRAPGSTLLTQGDDNDKSESQNDENHNNNNNSSNNNESGEEAKIKAVGKSKKALNTKTEDGTIVFDARRLFDLMDKERKGELSYMEINHALELNPVQFREFSNRMNSAARLPPETATVKRKVFVKNFLRVLQQISHFQPTPEEADDLYDDILEARGEPIDLDGAAIPHECLYTSPLADFLEENQIHELIKLFRQLQEKQAYADWKANGGDDESGFMDDLSSSNQNHRRPNVLRRVSNIILTTGRRRASMPTPITPRGGDGASSPPPPEQVAMEDMSSSNQNRGKRTRRTGGRPSTIARKVKRASIAVGAVDDKELEDLSPENVLEYDKTKWKRPLFNGFKPETLTRDEFVAWYPALLIEITSENYETLSKRQSGVTGGVDIAFQDLSLTVSVKKSTITIVDKVTGRLRAGTMTALMGGSGAGKTSLLNALCGRAHYGDVTGGVYINGHETSIEEHSSAVGFVPQDDIVYAELTVRENLIFSGKFMLPQGTPMSEIEDLADSTMASLGLSRVMHSMVGDVNRRGVSGGEKKRVNIGLELMSRPKILFLDEPTSGLDSNSALLVMSSLKTLVSEQGTTICSVIHQPRKFIFDLFDSLVLLGVGGKMVYHGPVSEAEPYFTRLHYELPPGEALADWLIDISSGRMEPKAQDEEIGALSNRSLGSEPTATMDTDDDEEPKALLSEPTAAEFENEAARAKSRREILYKHWKQHFQGLSEKQMEIYNAPDPFDLPKKRIMKPFGSQLVYQLHRLFVVGQRNWTVKFIDTAVIVGAVVLICIMDGTLIVTRDDDLNDLKYSSIAEPTSVEVLVREFPRLFRYAISGVFIDLQGHNTKLGVLVSVLVALSSTKLITDKRKEFFREAGSGYNVNAFFCAVNVMATLEHSLQILICAMFAIWLRSSLAFVSNYVVSFLMLGWITVSWALLFPLLVPQENVVMVAGFFIVIMSLLFSGANPPVLFETIYSNNVVAIVSGVFSPSRWFIEAQTVAEARCLPTQSGFTTFGPNFRGEVLQTASFQILGLGLLDFGEITIRSFDGWYWGALPSLVVGLLIRWVAAGVIHVSDRAKQSKKSLAHTLEKDPSGWVTVCVYIVILICLVVASVYLILTEVSTVE